MSIDASTIPFSPILVVAAVGYAAASAVITGPEIAAREIYRSGWQETCQADLVADLQATRRAERVIPQVPDVGGMLCSVYPELSDLCDMIPDLNTGVWAEEEQLREVEEARLRQAASGTADQCRCATLVYIEQDRVSLALYAASARLITPAAVSGRDAALTRALHSPACAFSAGGAS
ncbi:hypothetical protein [Pseudophaeobacter sp.]|uniref:hypothetical protein n=1 Tax=Pseudophaeobacter sp. TaxID=1971739 RepID=UPI002604399D|nr:hypothetical protein [Pseudophaeobacter sp.]